MEHKNNYREERGGSSQGVAVCPYECGASVAYSKKTESLVTCSKCKGTYLVDPVEKVNWYSYSDYQVIKQEQMAREKEEAEQRAAEKLEDMEFREERRRVRWDELQLRKQRLTERNDDEARKQALREKANELFKKGKTITEISRELDVRRTTLYGWIEVH